MGRKKIHKASDSRRGVSLDYSTIAWLATYRVFIQYRLWATYIPGAAFLLSRYGESLIGVQLTFFYWLIGLYVIAGILDECKFPWWTKFRDNEKRHTAQIKIANEFIKAAITLGVRGHDPFLVGMPYPKVSMVEISTNGNSRFKITVPPGLDRTLIKKEAGKFGAVLKAQSIVMDRHASGLENEMSITLVRHSLPGVKKDGSPKYIASVKGMKSGKVHLGMTHMGDYYWNTFRNPHIVYYGSTGSGKTFAARYAAMQTVVSEDENSRLVVIDMPNGGDTAPFTTMERCERIFVDPSKPDDGYLRVIAKLEAALVYINLVNTTCGKFKVAKWNDLPMHIKRQYPRLFLYLEEISSSIGKGGDEFADYRRVIGQHITNGILGGRKGGVHFIVSDQVTLSDGTYLASNAIVQLEQTVAMGEIGPRHLEPVFGHHDINDLPRPIPDGRGRVGFRNLPFAELQVPYLSQEAFVSIAEANKRHTRNRPSAKRSQ